MTDAETMQEVKACIRFYERRGKDWRNAVEFILAKHSGRLEIVVGCGRWYWRKRPKEVG